MHDASGLVKVGIASAAEPNQEDASFMPYRTFEALRTEQTSFRDLSAWGGEYIVMQHAEGSVWDFAALVGGNGFEVLGVHPHLCRLLAPHDDVRGGPSSG